MGGGLIWPDSHKWLESYLLQCHHVFLFDCVPKCWIKNINFYIFVLIKGSNGEQVKSATPLPSPSIKLIRLKNAPMLLVSLRITWPQIVGYYNFSAPIIIFKGNLKLIQDFYSYNYWIYQPVRRTISRRLWDGCPEHGRVRSWRSPRSTRAECGRRGPLHASPRRIVIPPLHFTELNSTIQFFLIFGSIITVYTLNVAFF